MEHIYFNFMHTFTDNLSLLACGNAVQQRLMCRAAGKQITRPDLHGLLPYQQRDELFWCLNGANDVEILLIYCQFCQTAAK